MEVRRHAARVVACALAGALAPMLVACAGDSVHVDPAATVLPTPTPTSDPAGHLLARRVHELLAADAVGVDEDLQTGRAQQEVRLTWSHHGMMVDASTIPISLANRPGTEVFRSPRTLLQREIGSATACWSPGGAKAARFDRPATPELAVLMSARATGERQGLMTGSLSAAALLGLLGSDEQLRRRGLDPTTDAHVPATFAVVDDDLVVTTGWGSLAAAAGAKRAGGTWSLRFQVFDAGGPSAPTADMMCP